jgi:hypothetical protein
MKRRPGGNLGGYVMVTSGYLIASCFNLHQRQDMDPILESLSGVRTATLPYLEWHNTKITHEANRVNEILSVPTMPSPRLPLRFEERVHRLDIAEETNANPMTIRN